MRRNKIKDYRCSGNSLIYKWIYVCMHVHYVPPRLLAVFSSSPSSFSPRFVGLSLCLSVTTWTKKIVDGFVPSFIGRFLGEREDPVRVSLRSVEGCESNGQGELYLPQNFAFVGSCTLSQNTSSCACENYGDAAGTLYKCSKNFDERPHRSGEFLRGEWMWRRSVGTMQSAAAVAMMPLLTFCGVHRSPQQWPTMPFVGSDCPQNCLFPLRFWPPSKTWILGLTLVTHPNGISIGSSRSVGLTNVANRETDTQTDHATPSIAIGRIWLLLRCGLIQSYHVSVQMWLLKRL